MKDEKIYGHLPKIEAEENTELVHLLQSEKWLYAQCKAPIWKKDEYAAQAVAWEKDETLEKFLKWMPGMCRPPKISSENECEWCNPLGRA